MRGLAERRADPAAVVGSAERELSDEQLLGLRRRAALGAGRRGTPPAAGLVAAARSVAGRARLGRRRLRSGGADHRLRPTGAVVQAADADAVRPRAADPAAAAPGASDPARHRRQGASGRRRRQGARAADRALRRRRGRSPPHGLPARLRHRHGPLPLRRVRRLAEQPAAPAGGLRHQRHEVGAERRAEPVDPRRLVGRDVRRPERLGDPHRRRRHRSGPPRQPRSRSALRPHRAQRGAALLRAADARRAGSAMVRHTLATLGPKVLASRMLRDYVNELYAPGRAFGAGGVGQRRRRRRGARRLAPAGGRRPGRVSRSTHVEASGVGDTPSLGGIAARAGRRLARRAHARPMSRCRRCTAGSTTPTRSPAAASHRRCTPAVADDGELDGGAVAFEGDVPLAKTGAFGYAVRVLPHHPLLASPVELGLMAVPGEPARRGGAAQLVAPVAISRRRAAGVATDRRSGAARRPRTIGGGSASVEVREAAEILGGGVEQRRVQPSPGRSGKHDRGVGGTGVQHDHVAVVDDALPLRAAGPAAPARTGAA